jgi:hypothetical protein
MRKTLRKVRSSKLLRELLRWKESVMDKLKIVRSSTRMRQVKEWNLKKLSNNSDHKIILKTSLLKY